MRKRLKLVLEFDDAQALLDFAAVALPVDAEVYKCDGLDFPHGGDAQTYVVRRHGDRPDTYLLRERVKARG